MGLVVIESTTSECAQGESGLFVLVDALLEALKTGDNPGTTLKITVLSWDSRTCFRIVEALLQRFREPPDNVEDHPRYHIIHERVPLSETHQLEVLGLQADAFEPDFAAPLIQNCHVLLVGADIEAGHVWGGERRLVDRLNEVRAMLRSGIAAGRVTIGAGAITDPGCDVIIPELARYVGWEDLETPDFLPSVLKEAASRLGLEIDPPASTTDR